MRIRELVAALAGVDHPDHEVLVYLVSTPGGVGQYCDIVDVYPSSEHRVRIEVRVRDE